MSATSSSSGCRTFRPGAVQNSSTGTVRVPLRRRRSRRRRPARSASGWSRRPGELLQRLPPRLARDWIWMPPMSEAESMSAGKRLRDVGVRRRCCAHGVGRADAQRAVGAERELRRLRRSFFTSTMTPTLRRPSRAWMMTSVPPARTRAAAPCFAERLDGLVERCRGYIFDGLHRASCRFLVGGVMLDVTYGISNPWLSFKLEGR